MDRQEAAHIARGHCRVGYYSIYGSWQALPGHFVQAEDGEAHSGIVGVLVGRHVGAEQDFADCRKFIDQERAMEFCVAENIAMATKTQACAEERPS